MGLNFGKIVDGAIKVGSAASPWLAAGTSLLGSIFGKKSQDSANQTNIQLQREQNQFNSQMFDKQALFNSAESQKQRDFTAKEREAQQAWQEKMIAEQNKYNDPSMQVFRNRQAGINALAQTSLASQSASPAGVPSGAGGAEAQASPVGTPLTSHVNPAIFDTTQLSSILADIGLKKAQTDNLNQKTHVDKLTEANVAELSRMSVQALRADIKLKKSQRKEYLSLIHI